MQMIQLGFFFFFFVIGEESTYRKRKHKKALQLYKKYTTEAKSEAGNRKKSKKTITCLYVYKGL